MKASKAHYVAALGYAALALWWVVLAFLLAGFLGPFGWFPLGLMGISLVGSFEHLEQGWEAKRLERPVL